MEGHEQLLTYSLHTIVSSQGQHSEMPIDDEQDREQGAELAMVVQDAIEGSIELTYVDQAYTGRAVELDADGWGIRLEVVKLPKARTGSVLLPRHWVVERSFSANVHNTL